MKTVEIIYRYSSPGAPTRPRPHDAEAARLRRCRVLRLLPRPAIEEDCNNEPRGEIHGRAGDEERHILSEMPTGRVVRGG